MNDDTDLEKIAIAQGGPFVELQQKIKLTREGQLHPYKRAIIFVAVAWGIPLLISFAEGYAWGPPETRPYLLQLTVWARFFAAVGIFVAMEEFLQEHLEVNIRPLLFTPLMPDKSREATAEALSRAISRRNSVSAEIICLVAAIVMSIGSALNMGIGSPESWAVRLVEDSLTLTWAAWWCLVISSPIFFFLLLRWLWRFTILYLFISDVSKLDIRLTATHPDQFGGIGFLGTFPNAYTPFVFALSCVIGAILAGMLVDGNLSITSYATVMAFWLLVVHALLTIPLMPMSKVLVELRTRTLNTTRAQATRRERALERTVLGTNVVDPDDDIGDKPEDIADPTALFNAAKKLPSLLFQRATLLPVSAAALLPLFAAGATQLPIKDLFKVLRKLLLI